MVATRRGAKQAPEVAPAPTNILSAPPKRGGRKKAAVEEVTEPAPAPAKPTKTAAAKRKAKAEPEDAEQPMAKKTVATRTARSAKVATKAEPAPAAPKRATRGRKVEEPVPVEELEVIEEASKPAATRTRKIAAVKKAAAPKPATKPAPKAEEPAIVEEPVAEEAPKPATRTRKAPAKKTTTTKKIELPVIEETIATEPVKPASRATKAAVPIASATAPVIAPRATRGRNAPAVTQDSPLKAPARKPTRKAAAVTKAAPIAMAISVAEAEPEPVEEPMLEPVEEAESIESAPVEEPMPDEIEEPKSIVPNEEPVPAEEHVPEPASVEKPEPVEECAPIEDAVPEPAKEPFAEFPGYPSTPAHIAAPIASKKAMAELPGYPTTPTHILLPVSNKDALAELAGYPKTPAHITAPMNTKDALAEMPGYPTTPTHIVAPTIAVHEYNDVEMTGPEDDGVAEHIEVLKPEEVETLQAPSSDEATAPATPIQTTTEVVTKTPPKPSTPIEATTPYPTTPAVQAAEEVSTPPTNIVWGVTDQEAFEELPAAYPNTPAHITAPITPRRALAELPDYPTTPSLALEAAIQEEISASVKKQTPSPQHFARLAGIPDELAETSEITDVSEITETAEVTFADIYEAPSTAVKPSFQLAPLKLAPSLAAPEPASPIKSALRSPQKLKMDAKTPKKAVTWTDHHVEESELSLYDGNPQERFLKGMVFYVDVTRNGREQNFLFSSLLEELGAKVIKDLSSTALTHVLFKDGDMATLEKCYMSKGAIKCVNVGWIIDSDAKKERLDEEHYLVDVSVAKPATPLPAVAAKPFTPFKTPSKYALPPSSECKLPSTPTSSEFDRSFNKENCEVGPFFDDVIDRSPLAPRTVPNKKSSFLFGRSPMKTPSKPNFLTTTPAKHSLSAIKPAPQAFTTAKKCSADSSFFSSSLGPPKKLRLF